MLRFLLRRLLSMLASLLVISLLAFAIIQLPPGDFVTSYAASMQAAGVPIEDADLQALRDQYGLDRPFLIQYAIWISRFFIHLVDCNNDWRTRCTRMVNRFCSLWHHAIICCNHQHHDISRFGTT